MTSAAPGPPAAGAVAGRPLLRAWLHPAVLAAAALSSASGFAQFGVIAALGDVAQAFGEGQGGGVAAELGLSATTLGLGLGLIRLAALGGLPLSALADHRGRKRVLLACSAAGLALTATAAVAPGYWWFVALFALGRPLLSATNAITGVVAAEETRSSDRAKAIALLTAAYGVGAGLTTLVRAAGGDALGFRGLFALCLVPLLCLPWLARHLEEPDRFARLTAAGRNRLGLGAVPAPLRGRLAIICGLAFAAAFVTSPVNSFVFAYAETVLELPRWATFAITAAAAPLALAGLLAGRWTADSWGRRSTSVVMHVVVGVAGIVTYAGPTPAAIGGYLLGLTAGAADAPPVGGRSAEIFPTAERATAAGWLTAASAVGAVTGLFSFGVLTDLFGGFAPTAVVVSLPVILSAPLYLRLPETRGMELEESAPDSLA